MPRRLPLAPHLELDPSNAGHRITRAQPNPRGITRINGVELPARRRRVEPQRRRRRHVRGVRVPRRIPMRDPEHPRPFTGHARAVPRRPVAEAARRLHAPAAVVGGIRRRAIRVLVPHHRRHVTRRRPSPGHVEVIRDTPTAGVFDAKIARRHRRSPIDANRVVPGCEKAAWILSLRGQHVCAFDQRIQSEARGNKSIHSCAGLGLEIRRWVVTRHSRRTQLNVAQTHP